MNAPLALSDELSFMAAQVDGKEFNHHVSAYRRHKTDALIASFYSRPSAEISRDLVASADDNKAKGYSND